MTRRARWRPGCGATLLAGLLSCLLPCLPGGQARAASWIDRLPADDPVLLAGRPAAALPPPAAGAPADAAAPSGLVGAVAARMTEAVSDISTLFGFAAPAIRRPLAGEALLETAAAPPMLPVRPEPAALLPAAPLPADDDEADPALLANFVFDRGERRPDGSFFVPKTLQRLFNVRTAAAVAADVPVTVRLSGRIVPGAHSHGIVQASQGGRFEAPEAGLPVLGDRVTEGQLLGLVVPSAAGVDRQEVRRELERLSTEIRVQTETLEILKQGSFMPFRDGSIAQAQQTLAGLRHEREAKLQLLAVHEPLRAPTSGVISLATAVAGRMVAPGEVVFEIIDPGDLWVQASAADPLSATEAAGVRAASALTPEGQALRLSYLGSGPALTQQATPVLFRIDTPPSGLRVGRPVMVTLRSGTRARHGMPVAREAVTLGSDGVEQVWEQTAPEVFLPHPVRTQDIDAATVLVLDPLPDGTRLVVRGARLMAQLQ